MPFLCRKLLIKTCWRSCDLKQNSIIYTKKSLLDKQPLSYQILVTYAQHSPFTVYDYCLMLLKLIHYNPPSRFIVNFIFNSLILFCIDSWFLCICPNTAISTGAEKFAEIFLGEFDTPEAIWSNEMRLVCLILLYFNLHKRMSWRFLCLYNFRRFCFTSNVKVWYRTLSCAGAVPL